MVSGQSEASLISFFINGLKPDLKSELNLAKSTSLWRAFTLAKAHEAHRGSGRFLRNSGMEVNSEQNDVAEAGSSLNGSID